MRTLLAALLVFASLNAFADDKSATDQALAETQAMLGNQKQMEDWAKTHPDAQQSMNQVKSLTGGNEADTAAVYKLASDIMASMTKEANGDGAGMEKILADAMKNPQAFAQKLTPEQRSQLQNLSKSIDSRAPTSAPH